MLLPFLSYAKVIALSLSSVLIDQYNAVQLTASSSQVSRGSLSTSTEESAFSMDGNWCSSHIYNTQYQLATSPQNDHK